VTGMLNESILIMLVTASITGAGLILAVYALVTPISSKVFRKRIDLLREKKQKFDQLKKEISPESSDKDFKQLKELQSEIRKIRAFPSYLGAGIFLVFLFYVATALISAVWLFSPPQNLIAELEVVGMFIFSTFGFLVVGVYTIVDVFRMMNDE
jgi:Flp pilus assembly protein TadB